MENLKVNETRNGLTCLINGPKVPGYFHQLGIHCNINCSFCTTSLNCSGSLGGTWDCQPRYRKDHQSVYFTKN